MSMLYSIWLSLDYPVRIPQQRLAYWPVPQNASTSLKYAFYYLRTGRQFVPGLRYNRQFLYHIHRVFPSRYFQQRQDLQGWTKLAVIQDPLQRLISAYCSRVIYHRDLHRERVALEQVGLNCEPTIQSFVRNLAQYRQISKAIRIYTDPQWLYLGENPNYFDYIVDLQQLSDLPRMIETPALILRDTQRGSREFNRSVQAEVDAKTRDLIFDFYQRDYSLYGAFLIQNSQYVTLV